MKKRILFITSLFPSESDPYRATFNVSIVRSLLKRLDGVVLAPERYLPFVGWVRRKAPACGPQPVPLKDGLEGIRIVRPMLLLPPLVGRSLHWVLYFLCTYKTAMGLMRKTDFSCIYSMYAYPDGAASTLLGLAGNKKVIVHVMGCDINLSTRYRIRRAIIRWSLKRAAHVISVSQEMKRTLVGLGIPPEKISVVYNGVDHGIFRPMAQGECRAQLGMDPDEKGILFVGSLEEVKGVETLLDSFRMLLRQVPDQIPFKLYLIGSGTLWHRLEQLIESSDLSGCVRLLGNRSSQEVAVWMNACDVFCLPSIREGLPNVILEAVSCNRPVVASNVGGIPEMLSSYPQGLLVQPNAPLALEEGLLSALFNSPRAPTPHCEEYSWDKFSLTIDAIINRIATEESQAC
jgi:glycosyltransferase involved in cell wall biosynthesis